MQKTIRINENQLFHLAQKARQDGRSTLSGFLYKKSSDTGKWQQRFTDISQDTLPFREGGNLTIYFVLYENLLFYYDGEKSDRPSGVALLEGCYCEKMVNVKSNDKNNQNQGYCFAIYYKKEGQRQYDLRTDTEVECNNWVETIRQASFSRTQELKEELEQKHLHLLQILESERQAKWHYVQQTEELAAEVKKLKSELRELKESRLERKNSSQALNESEELRKIKKVQSFFRGWLCRRRWKQIVEEYIRSEHAESMRKRNNIVFGLVECEEEYVQQLSIMVSCFLRPFKMAASSKKPIITHEDVNSTFLNAETLLFLHQIFLQGLRSKIENWPTLQLGDLFDMLLPMLGIYQEYVRNHHYSLQVLAEYKQKPEFNQLLKRYEEKPACEGRSLESFLTYPMHQIPRYIITLHELLAHTPHDHVDREKLEYAKSKLEELSNIMHDEVSETENIRKNLAIERMIVEGCDILLDVNQIFVRQGSLIQVINEKSKSPRARLGSFGGSSKERKEIVRQVFLFTNHLLITTRASNGRLHLAKNYGKINLVDCTLIEDTQMELFPVEQDNHANGETGVGTSSQHLTIENAQKVERIIDYNGVDFRILIETKNSPPISITLLASSIQEKAAWCSDISQCIEQLHYSDLLNSSLAETSSVSMPQSIRSDPKLYRDDVDIQFSRRLNSCKVPQIRHASLDRLMDRLTDLRFLSIDFLNTFLLTYRVFTNGITLVNALRRILNNPECGNLEARPSFSSFNSLESEGVFSNNAVVSQRAETNNLLIKPQLEKTRRISTGMMKMEVTGTESDGTDERCSHKMNTEISLHDSYDKRLISSAEAPDSVVISKSAPSSRRTGSLEYPNISARHAKFPIMKEEYNQSQSVQISVPNLSNLSQGIHENLYNSTVKEESEPSDSLTVNTENSGIIKIDSEKIEVTLSAEGNIPNENSKEFTESKFSDKLHDYIKFDSMSLAPGFGSCHTPSSSKMKLNLLAPPSSSSFTHADLSLDSYSNWSSSTLSMNNNKLAPIASCEILSEDRSYSSDDDDLTFRSILKPNEKETGFEEFSVIEQRQKMYNSQKSSSSSPDKVDKTISIETSSIVGKLSEHFKQISCPSYINSPPLPKAHLQLYEGQETKPQSLYSAISLPSSPNKQLNKSGVNPIKYKVEPIVIPEANLLDHKCTGSSSTPSQSKNPMTPNRIISPANSPKLPVKGLSITPKRSVLTISSRTSSMPTPTQSNLIAVSPISNNQFPGSSNLTITTSRSNTSFGDANKSRGPSVSESSPSPTFQESLPSSTLHPLASAALNLSPSTTVSYHHRQSSPKLIEAPNRTRSSVVSWSGTVNTRKHKRPSAISCPDHDLMVSPRPSVQLMATGDTSPPIKARAGAVVTSSRCSKRRSSNTAAAQAFAAATAGCINPAICNKAANRYYSTANPSGDIKALSLHNKRLSVIYTAATMRVLNVVRHWISKFPEDFDSDPELKNEMKCLLEDLVCNQNLIPNEHKVAGQLLRQLMDDQLVLKKIDLDVILTPIHIPSRDSFDTLSALDIAEQLTYLDHQIFRSIRSSELLNQTWMKADKAEKAPHVLLVSTRFNELSRLVVSEIVSRIDINDRVACIEKWAAIADICRCIHNYNGVLQICAAFVNSSVYRLKRTWEKVPKQSRVTIEKLQNLVSSDGRFKNMREALHRCDPPCIPYLGMYLTDLSFIEEGALNVSENKLINFCKMRMIAHTIREIQQYQQTPYRIERHPRVTDYLLDRTRLLEEEKTYQASLRIEPRQSISRQGQPILQ